MPKHTHLQPITPQRAEELLKNLAWEFATWRATNDTQVKMRFDAQFAHLKSILVASVERVDTEV